ncbi:hypothetical protein ONE63_001866 [Megalurothrips usitatus]|uniref:Matrix-remodeling-associated protein 7 helical domain-containing protein n=1 Tax=Megalurothrips usitatus TaxID=439358 RepID=A0AAV7XEC1_9NEOP|nr:hypothetical protein ONE63_001866 [Megalurothrips usitatus]
MVDTSTNWENLSIYYSNLSPVYICSSLFTIAALILTWWASIHKTSSAKDADSEESENSSTASKEPLVIPARGKDSKRVQKECCEDDSIKAVAKRLAAEKFVEEHSVMKHIKSARQSAIEKQLSAGLSEEQLLKERETQASQLAAIYKLLKEKEDQFQITSMDELQDQLKLYRA